MVTDLASRLGLDNDEKKLGLKTYRMEIYRKHQRQSVLGKDVVDAQGKDDSFLNTPPNVSKVLTKFILSSASNDPQGEQQLVLSDADHRVEWLNRTTREYKERDTMALGMTVTDDDIKQMHATRSATILNTLQRWGRDLLDTNKRNAIPVEDRRQLELYFTQLNMQPDSARGDTEPDERTKSTLARVVEKHANEQRVEQLNHRLVHDIDDDDHLNRAVVVNSIAKLDKDVGRVDKQLEHILSGGDLGKLPIIGGGDGVVAEDDDPTKLRVHDKEFNRITSKANLKSIDINNVVIKFDKMQQEKQTLVDAVSQFDQSFQPDQVINQLKELFSPYSDALATIKRNGTDEF
ncbi:hypothetical protein SAMD00019534_125750, partial [Acytostelium subglobosum LB1]|uniref:hypothetical protein n=1 Tax=Acytostelium subglobosum LB1 TaxID=1410327 RepID=UPI000644C2B0